MTLYTVVSIVIALCGSTFTAINQFSAFVQTRVLRLVEDASSTLTNVLGMLVDGGKQKGKAKRRNFWINAWYWVWHLSGLPPILVLLIFAFVTAWKVIESLASPAGAAITSNAVDGYRGWLLVVFWINVGSVCTKMVSWGMVELTAHFQRQCHQTLSERNPEIKISPETSSSITSR